MFLLNGEPGRRIDIADRGFQYGDGLFETLEILNGAPLFLDRHLERLASGCERLLLPPPDLELLTREALAVSAGTTRGVLKIILTRGEGGRGYRQPEPVYPNRLIGLYPFSDYPSSFHIHGVSVRICKTRLGGNPALAGIKHLNRLEQVLARAEWRDDGIQEGLMQDSAGYVIEGCMSNVFMVRNGVVFTPELHECGVAGIVRGIIMDLCRGNAIELRETRLPLANLARADEVFLTNSIIGVWPVIRIEEQQLKTGALTRTLQNMFNALRMAEWEKWSEA